jgi:hypothetical protein
VGIAGIDELPLESRAIYAKKEAIALTIGGEAWSQERRHEGSHVLSH